MSQTLFAPNPDHVRRIVGAHFHPSEGSPYWQERQRALGGDPRELVTDFATFKQYVGFRDLDDQRRFETASRREPVERFCTLRDLASEPWIWASQTGATTGAPKHGLWSKSYWDVVKRFSNEMLDAHGVPRGVNWLFIGPTGPHTTGRWIIELAESRAGRCFSVDLDPRFVKILLREGQHALFDRYVEHIWNQALWILRSQDVGVLFATSRLLEMVPERVDDALLAPIQAVVHAGTTLSRDTHRALRTEVFPGRPLVGVYGTSTTSVHFQKPYEPEDEHRVIYVPSSPHCVLEIVDDAGRLVEHGAEGHVATYRLTTDFLIPGFWERDLARRVAPYGAHASRFAWDWIEAPHSPEFATDAKLEGVY